MMRIFFFSVLTFWHISHAATAEPLRVLTDIAPVQSLVAMVMGNVGIPGVLLDGNADPHHVQLRPSQVRAIARADLVFWVGEPLTPWLADPLKSIVRPGAANAMLKVPGTTLLYFDKAQVDPHAWLDPENARLWVDAIATSLASADPVHSDIYRTNANRAKIILSDLTMRAHKSLNGVQGGNLITAHDSLGYFANRFNLTIMATLADGEAAAPGPAHISALRKLIANNDIACVVSDYGQPDDRIRTLTDGFSVQSIPLDTSGALLPAGPTLYPDMIRAMADAMSGCVASQR